MPTPGITVEFRDVHYSVPADSLGWAARLTAQLRRPADATRDTTGDAAGQEDLEAGRSATGKPAALHGRASVPILCGVNGVVAAGESLAILGPSGSGKTTLLNLLSGRSQFEVAAGHILFDQSPRNPRTKRQIGYVMQDDVFFANLTVRQTLEFTAAIRLSDALSKHEIRDRVSDVVSRLRLDKCQNTRIGDQQFDKGVSGGERKRVNIANELLAEPGLLLLDEPTSGLDASTAMTVVRLLRELANEGKTVISTIHQPSSAMFGLFDKLMLLSEGCVAYYGPAAEAQGYFFSIGYPFPPNYNPCDYLMQLVIDHVPCIRNDSPANHDPNSVARASETSGCRLVRLWREAENESTANSSSENFIFARVSAFGRLHGVGKGMGRAIAKRARDMRGKPDPLHLPVKYETSWLSQVRILSVRSLRQKRGKLLDAVQLQQLFAIIAIACLFWFRMAQTETTLNDRLGGLFFFPVFWAFSSMFSAMYAFPAEKAVLNKDRASGAYRLSAYYVAKTLVETPADCIYPTIFSLIVYWVVGFNPGGGPFIVFLIILIAVVLTSQSFGLAISAALLDVRRAQVLASCLILSSMLMAGYYINNENIPGFVRPLRYLSYLKYSYEALVRNEVLGQVYPCVADGLAHTVYSQNGIKCPVRGPDVLVGAKLDHSLSVIGNLGILLVWNVLVRLFGYLALKYLNINHKPKKNLKT
jgi:ABC-type multidrug transport system ATPase subunit